jgi:hypothetical protein
MRILRSVTENYDMSLEIVGPNISDLTSEAFIFNNANRFDRSRFEGRTLRGSHIVRDPRDLVISAYHYHLRTTEPWALRPQERWGGTSYQEHLRSFNEHDGLLTEIARCANSELKSMREWDYTQPEFLELRYEDVIRDEEASFARLFRHYGFREKECETSVRSGQPGEWPEAFKPEHVQRFKDLTGDLVVRLGYETNTDW